MCVEEWGVKRVASRHSGRLIHRAAIHAARKQQLALVAEGGASGPARQLTELMAVSLLSTLPAAWPTAACCAAMLEARADAKESAEEANRFCSAAAPAPAGPPAPPRAGRLCRLLPRLPREGRLDMKLCGTKGAWGAGCWGCWEVGWQAERKSWG